MEKYPFLVWIFENGYWAFPVATLGMLVFSFYFINVLLEDIDLINVGIKKEKLEIFFVDIGVTWVAPILFLGTSGMMFLTLAAWGVGFSDVSPLFLGIATTVSGVWWIIRNFPWKDEDARKISMWRISILHSILCLLPSVFGGYLLVVNW